MREEYLPIEDHGLIGDGDTAALVGRDGAIDWMCVPRFDSAPLFCGILDERRGGAYRIAPEGLTESSQRYDGDSGVLITEMRAPSGVVRVTDLMALRAGSDLAEGVSAGRCELVRCVNVVEGNVSLKVEIEPRGGAQAEPRAGGLHLRCPSRADLDWQFDSTVALQGLRSTIDLRAGQAAHFVLGWDSGRYRHKPHSPEEVLDSTLDCWRRWMTHFRYEGPQKDLVARSAITLKLLEYFSTGAIVAAPTSSLPERIGGVRNWDYRYSWLRDAAFTVYAWLRIGFGFEAAGFLGWVLDAIEPQRRPRVLYDLNGGPAPLERDDTDLEGYRGSRPVRWGNAAADQLQHDVYGEILDCAFQWAAHHGGIDEPLWRRLVEFVEAAKREWREPDQGIWEVRTPGRPFTYSAALCQVALNRGARLAQKYKLEGQADDWNTAAEEIRGILIEQAWSEDKKSLVEHVDGVGGCDASLLALPLRRVIRADHPRMVATCEAIRRHLDAGRGLLYRYRLEESPDGLPGHEGAFLLCSFWMVENLARQGRLQEANDLYDSLCRRANSVGLLSEQIDPVSGAFLGNFPQAISHVGLISAGVNLARAERRVPWGRGRVFISGALGAGRVEAEGLAKQALAA